MKIAFKNFITTLRRYKMASVLNIAGLTLAFTAFYVMMVQVTYDLGYNRSIKDADRIWTVNANWIGGGFSLTSPRGPFEAALAQCPEVEGSAIITRRWDVPVWVQESEFSFTEYAAVMDYISLPSLDLLGFRTVEGDLRQIENPNTVILPESLARLYGVHAGDRIFTSDTKPGEKPRPSHEWTVVGIYKDFADNTLMGEPRIYSYLGDRDMNDTSQYGYICMVKMRDGSVPDSFKKAWDDNMYRQRVARARDDDSAQSAEKGRCGGCRRHGSRRDGCQIRIPAQRCALDEADGCLFRHLARFWLGPRSWLEIDDADMFGHSHPCGGHSVDKLCSVSSSTFLKKQYQTPLLLFILCSEI